MSCNTYELDSLTDVQLSEVFAREVAGWGIHRRNTALWVDADKVASTKYEVHAFHDELRFATSADAVLPFIEASGVFPEIMRPWQNLLTEGVEPVRVWEVRFDAVWAIAPTFARAACIALIRAARAGKGRA